MNEIYLLNDGFFIKEDGKYSKVEGNLNKYLRHNMILDESVTLIDLFEALIKHESEIDYLFESWTNGYKLRPYYEQIKKDPKDKTGIKFIEFSWATDYFEWEDDDLKLQREFSMYINISGRGDDNYSIALSELNNLKFLTIKTKTDHKTNGLIFIDEDKLEKDMLDIFEGKTDINFQDFVGGLLYEISFHGYPIDKENFSDELDEISDSFDVSESIDGDDLMITFLEKDIERLLEEEKYEKAAKVKKEIELIEKHKKNKNT